MAKSKRSSTVRKLSIEEASKLAMVTYALRGKKQGTKVARGISFDDEHAREVASALISRTATKKKRAMTSRRAVKALELLVTR